MKLPKILKLKKQEFLYFMMLVFIFISTSAIVINKSNNTGTLLTNQVTKLQTNHYPDNPVLGAQTTFPILSAQGVYAIDLESGVPLYEKQADTKLLPASTTKIITALVALDVYKLDQIIKIPAGVRVDGQKIGLYEGELMSVENLLKALLIYSANDSAEALAKAYPFGREAFVNLMNIKAHELNMKNTNFYNPAGLDGDAQYSTAKDLVRAVEIATKNHVFMSIVGTKETEISDVNKMNRYKLKNINKLLWEVEGVKGIKTGWTENARENLVTYIERDGHTIIIALLGSSDRFGETKELINWIFESYHWDDISFP